MDAGANVGNDGNSGQTIVSLARRYGRAKNAFIQRELRLQRHAGGGMAVRTIACLPAITGHWRRAGGGVQLSTSKNFSYNVTKLHRGRGTGHAHDQHDQIGRRVDAA